MEDRWWRWVIGGVELEVFIGHDILDMNAGHELTSKEDRSVILATPFCRIKLPHPSRGQTILKTFSCAPVAGSPCTRS